MNQIDPIQLQRLIDGELDQSQIQQLLAEATSAPEKWQEIAAGFVENQLWDRAFRSNESASPKMQTVSAPDVDHSAAVKQDPGWKKNSIHQRSNYSWLVMAASILVAAMMGYMAHQIQNRNIPSSEVAEETLAPISEPLIAQNSPVDPSTEPKLTPASLRPDYHLEVPQDNVHLRDVHAAGPVAPVPLYRIGNAEQLRQFNLERKPTAFPPEIIRRLSGSGYQMQQDIHFISGRLGDGRSFVVPVRTIRFVPGQ